MADYNLLRVVSQYFPLDNFIFTYNLADGMSDADVGKALTRDASAENQFKLAADGEKIGGRLFQFEDRTGQGGGFVGSVERKFKAKLPAPTGHGISVGDPVCGGATAGEVRTAVEGTDPITNEVTEVGDDYVVVESL